MSEEDDCKTAPATPGLLIRIDPMLMILQKYRRFLIDVTLTVAPTVVIVKLNIYDNLSHRGFFKSLRNLNHMQS